MLACSIFSTSRKDCDCDVTWASIGSSRDVSSLLPHGTQTAINSRAVELQPRGGQRPERSLVIVQARTTSFTTCTRTPSSVPTWCSLRQRLSSSRASPPGSLYVAMARKQSFQVCPLAWRPRVTRLRAPTFPGGGQQGFLWRIHRALLGACEARARESVLEELPAISDRGGVGGGVRAKQNDRRLRGRSEERRGGKEGRSRGAPYHLKKKKEENVGSCG